MLLILHVKIHCVKQTCSRGVCGSVHVRATAASCLRGFVLAHLLILPRSSTCLEYTVYIQGNLHYVYTMYILCTCASCAGGVCGGAHGQATAASCTERSHASPLFRHAFSVTVLTCTAQEEFVVARKGDRSFSPERFHARLTVSHQLAASFPFLSFLMLDGDKGEALRCHAGVREGFHLHPSW